VGQGGPPTAAVDAGQFLVAQYLVALVTNNQKITGLILAYLSVKARRNLH